MRIISAIVTVEQRREHARAIQGQLPWFTELVIDKHGLGCTGNHLRAWGKLEGDARRMRWLQHDSWCLVLEDDAVLNDGYMRFGQHAIHALDDAPADVVSFYLGTGRPVHWQKRMESGVRAARPWIVSTKLLHAVAVAIRAPLVGEMLDCATLAAREGHKPIDEAITEWLMAGARPVAYTNPSLVDHQDGPTTTAHPDGHARTQPRKAWNLAGLDRVDWSTRPFSVI